MQEVIEGLFLLYHAIRVYTLHLGVELVAVLVNKVFEDHADRKITYLRIRHLHLLEVIIII